MIRIQLRVYKNPGMVEVLVNIKRADEGYEPFSAKIDTGAEVSLFPRHLLEVIEYQPLGKVQLQQAGIARQQFEADEGMITLPLEDTLGHTTHDLKIRAWFADSNEALLGFEGLLDRANLQISMLAKLEGFLEIDA